MTHAIVTGSAVSEFMTPQVLNLVRQAGGTDEAQASVLRAFRTMESALAEAPKGYDASALAGELSRLRFRSDRWVAGTAPEELTPFAAVKPAYEAIETQGPLVFAKLKSFTPEGFALACLAVASEAGALTPGVAIAALIYAAVLHTANRVRPSGPSAVAVRPTAPTLPQAVTREGALAELLLSLFSEGELDSLIVCHIDPDLANDLAGKTTPRERSVSLALALQRRGLANQRFFAHLASLRPGRTPEVREVADRF